MRAYPLKHAPLYEVQVCLNSLLTSDTKLGMSQRHVVKDGLSNIHWCLNRSEHLLQPTMEDTSLGTRPFRNEERVWLKPYLKVVQLHRV